MQLVNRLGNDSQVQEAPYQACLLLPPAVNWYDFHSGLPVYNAYNTHSAPRVCTLVLSLAW